MSREPGIPNKNKRGLKAQLKQTYGKDFDVIMMMADNCVTLHAIAQAHKEGAITVGEASPGDIKLIDATSSAKVANEALEKLAQYVEPKLKAIEISGTIDQKHTVKIIDLSGTSGAPNGDDSVSD
jgi:hypothetical protein